MVDKKHGRTPAGRKLNRLSPPPLPPRWGEGVAPPSSPQTSHQATPVTSPVYKNSQWNYQQGNRETTMRRKGGSSSYELSHVNPDLSCTESSYNREEKIRHLHKFAVLNHPSPNTSSSQFIQQVPTHKMQVPVMALAQQSYENTHTRTKHKKSQQVAEVSGLPLSYPSPPLLTKHRNIPLTSTLMVSPPKPFNAEDYSIHPTSPATPEISTISLKVTDATTYQNYEGGIAYIPTNLFKSQATNSQPQAVNKLSHL